ncbi:hypothetical protein E8E13_002372 [Curvularia kusanoi]|uniref:Uncharacterized protein n=1 Tax=Curvularia kusanoi TaxID=90978 RepID=A0A9P4W7U5_CURKU|nr:hypothetical protein E8E13_002372 [Curvularia kusanoi]
MITQEGTSQPNRALHTRPGMQAATTEAKAQCLQLSTLLSGDLQTELSDGKIRTDHDIYPEDDLILPSSHIFNADYMGQDVVLELLKMYYENNTFSVCNIEGGLDKLCTAVASSADGAALDFVPLDHIHDLQIRVKCEHFTAYVSSAEEAGPKRRLEELAEKLSFLDRTVESLQILRSRAQASSHDLNVEFVLMSDLNSTGHNRYYLQLHLTNLLQAIRNAVYELLHDREHTTVRVTSQDDSVWAFPRNYTGLFKMAKNKWEHEKSKQRPNRDWSSDFWVPPLGWIVLPGSTELMDLGGYIDNSYGHPTYNNLQEFHLSRWGINDILRDTTSSASAEDADFVDDSYWPVGIPFNHRLLQTLIDRGVFEAEEDMFSEDDW